MSYGSRIDVASNNGAGNGSDFSVHGGTFHFIAEATWGGGNIKLQVKTLQGTYIDVPNSTISANNVLSLTLCQGTYRYVITTSSAVYAWLVMV